MRGGSEKDHGSYCASWSFRENRIAKGGFWPGDVAAGIVGGAIGTAGAIAAAPFGAGPYAYYNGPYLGER